MIHKEVSLNRNNVVATRMQKKVCLLGAFAVGKTSLVRRFVESIFSDHYHSTIGVKINKKVVHVGDHEIDLILWDIQGKGESQLIPASYLNGASACLLVADGTRPCTVDEALEIVEATVRTEGRMAIVLALNKSDLAGQWEIEAEREQRLRQEGWAVIRTSAKTGEGIERAFYLLSQKMLEC